jgi:hypothetical protein
MQVSKEKYEYINNYNQIAKDFLNNYYNIRNNNLSNSYMFYHDNCLFTLLGNELKGFNNYIKKIKELYLNNMKFLVENIEIQPSINKTLLVNVKGKFQNNNMVYPFLETLIIKKNMFDRFVIYNNIFRKI